VEGRAKAPSLRNRPSNIRNFAETAIVIDSVEPVGTQQQHERKAHGKANQHQPEKRGPSPSWDASRNRGIDTLPRLHQHGRYHVLHPQIAWISVPEKHNQQ
jgi:hypothetical protein